jgi:DNA-binding MarR family transcriptional regulator
MAYEPADADLSLAAMFAGWAMSDEVLRRLAADGMKDLRLADGVVFQHLIEQPRSITEIARRIEVTQQAASKAVADLERRGYVTGARDPADRRARLIALTARGERAIARARRHRADLERELADRFGARRTTAARRLLLEIVAELGGEPAIRGRRVRPPALTIEP